MPASSNALQHPTPGRYIRGGIEDIVVSLGHKHQWETAPRWAFLAPQQEIASSCESLELLQEIASSRFLAKEMATNAIYNLFEVLQHEVAASGALELVLPLAVRLTIFSAAPSLSRSFLHSSSMTSSSSSLSSPSFSLQASSDSSKVV